MQSEYYKLRSFELDSMICDEECYAVSCFGGKRLFGPCASDFEKIPFRVNPSVRHCENSKNAIWKINPE